MRIGNAPKKEKVYSVNFILPLRINAAIITSKIVPKMEKIKGYLFKYQKSLFAT